MDTTDTRIARTRLSGATRRLMLGAAVPTLALALSLMPALTPAAGAAQPDGDGDGLYDDDELYVYGTDAYAYDTDGDGVGDGEEVYYGTDPAAGGIEFGTEGDNANQCAAPLQFGNTGNVQNAGAADDVEFGGEVTFEPSQAVECTQEVQQSSAASG